MVDGSSCFTFTDPILLALNFFFSSKSAIFKLLSLLLSHFLVLIKYCVTTRILQKSPGCPSLCCSLAAWPWRLRGRWGTSSCVFTCSVASRMVSRRELFMCVRETQCLYIYTCWLERLSTSINMTSHFKETLFKIFCLNVFYKIQMWENSKRRFPFYLATSIST